MSDRQLLIGFYVSIAILVCSVASAGVLYYLETNTTLLAAQPTNTPLPAPIPIDTATLIPPTQEPTNTPEPAVTPEPPTPTFTPEPTATLAPTATPEPPTPTFPPVPTDTPIPTPKPPTIPSLGDVVEKDGYSLSATNVEDPTTPGMFYEAKEGMKLVAVEIIIGNISGEQHTVNPLNATLLDDEGFSYKAALGERKDGQIELVDLNPGEKVKGWIAFEMPNQAIPTSIKYDISLFSQIVLQTGLTTTP